MGKHAYKLVVREVAAALGVSRAQADRLLSAGLVGRHAVEKVLQEDRGSDPWNAFDMAAALSSRARLDVAQSSLVRLVWSDLDLLATREGPVSKTASVAPVNGAELRGDRYSYDWLHAMRSDDPDPWDWLPEDTPQAAHERYVRRSSVWVTEVATAGPSTEDGLWRQLPAGTLSVEAYRYFISGAGTTLYLFRPDGSIEIAISSVEAPPEQYDPGFEARSYAPNPDDFPEFDSAADLVGVRYTLDPDYGEDCFALESDSMDLEHLSLLVPRLPGHAMRVEYRGEDPDPNAQYLSFDDPYIDHGTRVYSWGVRTRDGILTMSEGIIDDPAQSRADSAEWLLAKGPGNLKWTAPDLAREMVQLGALDFGGSVDGILAEARAGLAWAALDSRSRVSELKDIQDDLGVAEPTYVYLQDSAEGHPAVPGSS